MNKESLYIKELKNGSQAAFNTLYDIYCARLYGYCYQYTKSHQDAEEIVQDVFVKLWTYKETIRDEDTILYFLFRIARNQLINNYRSKMNSPTFEEYVSYNNDSSLSVNTTTQAIEYDDFCKLIDSIRQTLPETQQKVYEYSKHQQMSNKEIAETLHLSEQTVKNQLSQALKVFKEKLSKYYFLYLLILLFYR